MKAIYLHINKSDKTLAHITTADNAARGTVESQINYLRSVAVNKINHPTDNKISKFYHTLVNTNNSMSEVWDTLKIGVCDNKEQRDLREAELRDSLEAMGMRFFKTKKNKKG
jgi:hypothetical protein